MNIRELYEQLYYDCENEPSFRNDAHFVSMEGAYYRDNKVRLLLIGRATNGWESLSASSADTFAKEAASQFNDKTRFNWIEEIEGIQYSRHDRDRPKKERYKVNTPFWDRSNSIFHFLTNGEYNRSAIWQENIAWTNLYKFSPKISNNPELRVQEMQRETCREILKFELEYYAPTHILFLTGFDWFEPFSDLFTDVCLIGSNISSGVRKNNIYAEGTALYNNAKVVIACRPEFRMKEPFVSDVEKQYGENNHEE